MENCGPGINPGVPHDRVTIGDCTPLSARPPLGQVHVVRVLNEQREVAHDIEGAKHPHAGSFVTKLTTGKMMQQLKDEEDAGSRLDFRCRDLLQV